MELVSHSALPFIGEAWNSNYDCSFCVSMPVPLSILQYGGKSPMLPFIPPSIALVTFVC